ncbi:hypothetical protein TWF481_011790 [Arthrobotrys musiformis]|uniref:Cryptic loci regulator 2 C-terminal domain-containing protein n=1 Tax=Arthrobotrys musiformis TaxID=47236 RepID=A0AAV9VXY8_9PEZI
MARKKEWKFKIVPHGDENYIHMEGAQEWRDSFFGGSKFKTLQENKIKDISNIPEDDLRFPIRQDSKRTQLPGTETRDWYDFHSPTGAVLFPYDFTTISTPLSNSTSGLHMPQLKRLLSEKKRGMLNGISTSNYRRIQDLKRGDRVVLPNDSQIHTLNKGIIPKGVLIIARIGTQEITGYAALQVRTYIDLKLYEFILPHHIRSLHLVETETSLMAKQPPSVLLPGYFTLRHAYLIKVERDEEEGKEGWVPANKGVKSKLPLFRFELAFVAENGTANIQKFICSETLHESVDRLSVSWDVGLPTRVTNFAQSNRWVVWLLKYIPSTLSTQAKQTESRWIEAETYQVLGWSTSGVLATGSDSLGAIQTSELTAGTKMYEDDLYRVLSEQVEFKPVDPSKAP